ncbi:MAG: carboxypeptidase-like regulatory domain-containing protein, partial [Bryobacteraceae bacterium]
LKQSDNGEWTGYAGTLWHPSVEEVRNIVPVTLDPGADLRGVDPVLRQVKVHPLKGVLYDQLTREPLTHATVGLRVAGAAPVEVLAPRAVDEETGAFEFPSLPEEDYDLLVYRGDPGMNLPWPVRISLGGTPLQTERLFVPGSDPVVDAFWTRLGHTAEDGVGVLVPAWTAWSGRLSFHGSLKPDQGGPDLDNYLRTEVRLIPLDLPEFTPVIASFDPRRPQVDQDGLRRGFDLQSPLLPPGSYALEVAVPEGWFLESITSGSYDLLKRESAADGVLITPSMPGVEINLQRGGATVEGLVANRKSEPLPNATVCAASDEAWRRRQPGGAFCVRADSDGKFRSRWLSPGPWRVWAFPKKPLERPGSEAFETRYARTARPLDVPPEAGLLRLTLLAAE